MTSDPVLSRALETLRDGLTVTSPPATLNQYRLLSIIGRGGMGVVYAAEDTTSRRRVALKVLAPAFQGSPHLERRFQREIEAARSLHHTHIVPILDIGKDRGFAYYVMPQISGFSLDLFIDQTRDMVASSPSVGLDREYFQRVAMIGAQLARALSHAHQREVLHRDLKPSNILVDGKGNAWMTDFGLAKLRDDDNLTRTGVLVGTLRYMAPERMKGHATASSDIYSLGLTLYEFATLRPAFDEPDPESLTAAISHRQPKPPRKLDSALPRDLETVILKAIAKHPQNRYDDARSMAIDLEALAEGNPIRTRRARPWVKLWRFGVTHPAMASMIAITFTSLTIASLIGWSSSLAASRALAQATQSEQLAISAFDELYGKFVVPDVAHPAARLLRQTRGDLDRRSPRDDLFESLTRVRDFYDRRLEGTRGDDAAAMWDVTGDLAYRMRDHDDAAHRYDRAAAEHVREGDDAERWAKAARSSLFSVLSVGRSAAIESCRSYSNEALFRQPGHHGAREILALLDLTLAQRHLDDGRDLEAAEMFERGLRRLDVLMDEGNDSDAVVWGQAVGGRGLALALDGIGETLQARDVLVSVIQTLRLETRGRRHGRGGLLRQFLARCSVEYAGILESLGDQRGARRARMDAFEGRR